MNSWSLSLNPYCSGQWSRTQLTIVSLDADAGLNPYCSGQWSRTISVLSWTYSGVYVLILIVVDNGLVPMNICKESKKMTLVLILVVVDNGLVHSVK